MGPWTMFSGRRLPQCHEGTYIFFQRRVLKLRRKTRRTVMCFGIQWRYGSELMYLEPCDMMFKILKWAMCNGTRDHLQISRWPICYSYILTSRTTLWKHLDSCYICSIPFSWILLLSPEYVSFLPASLFWAFSLPFSHNFVLSGTVHSEILYARAKAHCLFTMMWVNKDFLWWRGRLRLCGNMEQYIQRSLIYSSADLRVSTSLISWRQT